MRVLSACVSFVLVFIISFALGGLLFMPYLPPTPDHPVSFVENEYWTTNWAGALLGLVLGGLSARSILRKSHADKQTPDLRDEPRSQ